jgi:hypothetical protein
MDKRTYEKYFAKRGISREVAERRPYGRYRKGHPEDIWKWDPKYRDLLTPPQRAAVTRNVNQSAGTVMVRYTVSEAPNAEALFGPMWAELRPDEAVVTGRRTHRHPDPPEHATAAERAKFERNWRSHIDRGKVKERDPDDHRGSNALRKHTHPHLTKPIEWDAVSASRRTVKSLQNHIDKYHPDGNPKGRHAHEQHSHRDFAKYLFPKGGTVLVPWFTHHDDHREYLPLMGRPKVREIGPFLEGGKPIKVWEGLRRAKRHNAESRAKLDRHVELYHDPKKLARAEKKGQPLLVPVTMEGAIVADWDDGGTMHTHMHAASDPADARARRIDVHPIGRTLLKDARIVFFCIEGCLKADSVLTAILAEGRTDVSVVSVPSVTLWDAPEFLALGWSRRGKTVYIIPDGDWTENDRVILQAFLCRTALIKVGVDAQVVSPPRGRGKGVDDFLGPRKRDATGGGNLDELVVLRRDTLSPGFQRWAEGDHPSALYDVPTVAFLANHADHLGRIRASAGMVARHAFQTEDKHVRRGVQRAIKRLAKSGEISIDRPMTELRDQFRTKKFDWDRRPIITVREDLHTPTVRVRLDGTPVPVRVYNRRHKDAPPDVVFIGRADRFGRWPASKWQNPYREGRDGTREEVIGKFREYLLGNPELMADLGELRGRDLVCWCAPLPCHGDVLLELANADVSHKEDVPA